MHCEVGRDQLATPGSCKAKSVTVIHAIPLRVRRYSNLPSFLHHNLNETTTRSLSSRLPNDCGAPPLAKPTDPGSGPCSDSRWRCCEFLSAPKANAQRVPSNKRTACRPPSTMGDFSLYAGLEHVRHLKCANLIRRTAINMYWFGICCKADCVARGWRFSALRLDA
jgi:hypothetical protein